MKPLRIVLVMIEAPVPFGNAAARWFYVLLKELVARGHKVTAFAACSKQSEIDEAKKLFPAPEYDLRLYPFPKLGKLESKLTTLTKPYSYMFGVDLKEQLKQVLATGYDVLHLEQLWTAWLVENVDKSLVNVHHLVWIDQEELAGGSLSARFNRWLMFRAERMLIRRIKFIRSCSSRLVPEMLKVNRKARIETVPVGIDATIYPYIPNEKRGEEPIVSVIGNMGWHPSSSAAIRLLSRLWPEIKRRVPSAKLQIVGWSARSVLKDYLYLTDVTIEENVPDMKPYFEKTAVFVYAPARGSGMKIKILEALGYGIPVVTTSEGSEGLNATDGVNIGEAEDDAGLVDRAVKLLLDPELRNKQRAAGRELLETRCGPKTTVDGIEAMYSTMIASGGQS